LPDPGDRRDDPGDRIHLSHPMVGVRWIQIADFADEEVTSRIDGQRPGVDEPGFRGQTAIPRKTVHAVPRHGGDNAFRADLAHPVVKVVQDPEVPVSVYRQADGTVQSSVRSGPVVPEETSVSRGAR